MPIATSPREVTILNAAQDFVNTWFRSSHRRPFREAVTDEEQKRFAGTDATGPERAAFRKTANAIRVGYGHATSNPKPLLEITRRVLRE